MTTAELFAELSTNRERIWLLLQYWSSVSFGLIIAIHVVKTRLSWLIVSLLMALYTSFTVLCLQFIQEANLLAGGFLFELEARLEQLSTTPDALPEVQRLFNQAIDYADPVYSFLSIFGLYFMVIAYIIYRQRTVRRDSNKANETQ